MGRLGRGGVIDAGSVPELEVSWLGFKFSASGRKGGTLEPGRTPGSGPNEVMFPCNLLDALFPTSSDAPAIWVVIFLEYGGMVLLLILGLGFVIAVPANA